MLFENVVWLAAMGVLVLFSAFFSSSEAALFYLGRTDLECFRQGNQSQRIAARLLDAPDRLLTAVLFWNLLVNLTYFSIVSIIGLRLEREGRATEAWGFAIGSLLVIIVFSEMLPKSLAVLHARRLAAWFALPLAAVVRLLDPVLPIFRVANLLSQRLIWPKFQPESYLRVGDLERAVELSTTDATTIEHEQTVLQNIVMLSDIRVDELMRPRTRFHSFRPPVSLSDLEGQIPPSGYLLVTEPDSDEIAGSITLERLTNVPTERLEDYADPVAYVPWSTPVAGALEIMQQQPHRVAAVINEFGETIGILTRDDILDTLFQRTSSRTERLLSRASIRQVSPGVWHVAGLTTLRRLARQFHVERPAGKSITVAGLIQELLERFPQRGDECLWGPFRLKVLDAADGGQMLVELTRTDGLPGEMS